MPNPILNRLTQKFSLPGWVSNNRYLKCLEPQNPRFKEDFKILEPETMVEYPLPSNVSSREELNKNIFSSQAHTFYDVPELQISAAYQVTFRNVHLLYHQNEWNDNFFALITDDKKSIIAPGLGYAPEHRVALRRSAIEYDELCCVLGMWMNNYYLWHTNYLCRIMRALEQGHQDKFVFPEASLMKPFARETLERLGIHPKARIGKENPHLFVKELTFIMDHPYRGSQLRAFRSKLHSQAKKPPTRKIYISREKAHYRHFVNEAEVQALFLKHGWEIHCMEDYSYAQQIKLISECCALAGLHGAGFGNMLFMPEGGEILEFSVKERPNANFYALAVALKHRYWLSLVNTAHNKDDTIYDDALGNCKEFETLILLIEKQK